MNSREAPDCKSGAAEVAEISSIFNR